MASLMADLGAIIAAMLLGGMAFFAAGVAPQVFRALEPAPAGLFLRRLFPVYYAFIIALSALAAGAYGLGQGWIAAGFLAAVALSTLWVRQVLTPKLNHWRDAEIGGDVAAGARFKTGHRLSVLVNMVQLLGLLALLGARLAA